MQCTASLFAVVGAIDRSARRGAGGAAQLQERYTCCGHHHQAGGLAGPVLRCVGFWVGMDEIGGTGWAFCPGVWDRLGVVGQACVVRVVASALAPVLKIGPRLRALGPVLGGMNA